MSTENLFANIAPAAETKKPAEQAAPKDIPEVSELVDNDDEEIPMAPDEGDETPPVVTPAAPTQDEIDRAEALQAFDLLKSRARMMGITFSNNIGPDALAAKVKAKVEGVDDEPETKEEVKAAPVSLVPEKSLRQHLYDENMKLVRIRLTNLDPKDAGLPGEIFTVANEYLGTVTKLIPYSEAASENGYHVPYCIFKQLKSRKFLKITVSKNSKGQEVMEHKYVRKYAIEILAPLTGAEIQRLATAQLAAGSLED